MKCCCPFERKMIYCQEGGSMVLYVHCKKNKEIKQLFVSGLLSFPCKENIDAPLLAAWKVIIDPGDLVWNTSAGGRDKQ